MVSYLGLVCLVPSRSPPVSSLDFVTCKREQVQKVEEELSKKIAAVEEVRLKVF